MREQPYRLVWHCPDCNKRHEAEDTRAKIVEAAGELLADGVLMLAIYDGGYAAELDLDEAEANSRSANWFEWFGETVLGVKRKSL